MRENVIDLTCHHRAAYRVDDVFQTKAQLVRTELGSLVKTTNSLLIDVELLCFMILATKIMD